MPEETPDPITVEPADVRVGDSIVDDLDGSRYLVLRRPAEVESGHSYHVADKGGRLSMRLVRTGRQVSVVRLIP